MQNDDITLIYEPFMNTIEIIRKKLLSTKKKIDISEIHIFQPHIRSYGSITTSLTKILQIPKTVYLTDTGKTL